MPFLCGCRANACRAKAVVVAMAMASYGFGWLRADLGSQSSLKLKIGSIIRCAVLKRGSQRKNMLQKVQVVLVEVISVTWETG